MLYGAKIMSDIYKIIMLSFSITHSSITLSSESLNKSLLHKNFTPILVITSFFLGYAMRYVNFKKTRSLETIGNTLTLSNRETVSSNKMLKQNLNDYNQLIREKNELSQRCEQLSKKNSQCIKAKELLESENTELKKTNQLLTVKVNAMKQCVDKVFSSALAKESSSIMRFKAISFETNKTTNDNRDNAQLLATEFLEIFELKDTFKPVYNRPARSWLFKRI